MIFSKTYCPFCSKAKDLLKAKNASFCALEMDKESAEVSQAASSQLLQLTQQKTVPNIFINAKHIGGCSDLERLDASGELDKLLSTAALAG